MTVVVLTEFLADGLQLGLVGLEVHGSHGFEIGCVEPRRQDRFLGWILDRNGTSFCDGGGRDHRLRFHVPAI